MNCDEFDHRWNELLDERLNPEADPALTAHAAGCDDCRARLVGSRVLVRGLSRFPVPRADFSRRVMAAAAAPPAQVRSASRFWLAGGVLLASAAAALLAISIVWYARRGSAEQARGQAHPAPPVAVSPK